MAITFFGASSIPADNGTSALTQMTIVPPSSMQVNDLVVVYTQQRGSITSFTVGVTGGQGWTSLGTSAVTSNIVIGTFYCVFNGTWSANPRFDSSVTGTNSAVMLVFRSNSGNSLWGYEQLQTVNSPAAATHTVTGITPTNPENVTIAAWFSADDNTWGSLSGTGWDKTGLSAQYRNLDGTDQSSTYAYLTQTTPASVPNVSQTQLTLGNDATTWRRVTFYNFESISIDPFGMMGIFGI